jgi:hypothetical protein
MSKNSYVLVNPYIKGEFENTINAKNSFEAAKLFYKNMSEHFNNNVPAFHFTIQKGQSGGGKFLHFKVKENKNKDKEVNFSIEPYSIKNEKNIQIFEDKLNKIKNKMTQEGGKKRSSKKKSRKYDDDEDSESDDSDDYYRIARNYTPTVTQPYYYWWYDPYVYNLNSFYVPTFYSYVTPYIEISTSTYATYST